MGANNKIDNGQSPFSRIGDNVTSNFEGIIAVKPIAKYLTGARCVLKVNNEIIGFAFAISWNINTSVTEIRTIDNVLPYELAPKQIEVTGSISAFRIPGSGPTQKLLQTDMLNHLHQRYIQIEVHDSQSDNLIFRTNNALVVGRSESIRTGQMAEMTLNFRAIGWADERSPELYKDVGAGNTVNNSGSNSLDNLKDAWKNRSF